MNVKSVAVGEIFFDKQPALDTCYQRHHPACEHDTSLTVEDRLLTKTLQTEKAGLLKKIIVEFPARQWKWHMLFDLLQIIESTGFAKGCVVAINVVQSELNQISSQLIT